MAKKCTKPEEHNMESIVKNVKDDLKGLGKFFGKENICKDIKKWASKIKQEGGGW